MRNMTHIFLNRLLSGGASYTLILPCARRSADAFTQETPRSKQVPLSYSPRRGKESSAASPRATSPVP